jgi:hypothetical protein
MRQVLTLGAFLFHILTPKKAKILRGPFAPLNIRFDAKKLSRYDKTLCRNALIRFDFNKITTGR